MRIIYSRGFQTQERQWWRRIIFHNIIETFEMISDAMNDFTIAFDNPDNEVRVCLYCRSIQVCELTSSCRNS